MRKRWGLLITTFVMIIFYAWIFLMPIPDQLGVLFDEAYLQNVKYSSQERQEQVENENEGALERARERNVIMKLPEAWQAILFIMASFFMFCHIGIWRGELLKIIKSIPEFFLEEVED